MASIYQKGKYWYISYYEPGSRRHINTSLKTKDKKIAQEMKKRYEARLLDETLDRPAKTNVAVFLEKEYLPYIKPLLSTDGYNNEKHKLELFIEHSKPITLANISERSIESFLGQLRLNPHTINQYRRVIRKFLAFAVKRKMLARNACDAVDKRKEIKKDPFCWTEEEVSRILEAAAGSWLEDLLIMYAYTGLRKSHVLKLTWKDIDFTDNVIRYTTTKAGHTRSLSVPMHERVADICKKRKRSSKSKYVFIDQRTRKPYTPDYVRKSFNRLLENIKNIRVVPGKKLHIFRHSLGTVLLKKGESLEVIQEYLGHSRITTTQIYAKVVGEKVKKAAKRLSF